MGLIKCSATHKVKMSKNSEICRQEREMKKKPPEELEIIEGHIMLPVHWVVFDAFCETGNYSEAARRGGISRECLSDWRKKAWWKKKIDEFLVSKQQEFHTKLAARQKEISDGYFEVMTGADKDDKTAGARIQGTKLFMEMGDNPLIKKNSNQFGNVYNSHVNNLSVDYSAVKSLANADPQLVLEMARTGVVPDEFKTVTNPKDLEE